MTRRRSIALMDPRRFLRDDIWDNFLSDGVSAFAMNQYSLDMYETDDEVIVEVEAPKFKPEDVDISIEDKTLTISGHSKSESEDEDQGKKYHFREITQQSFSRSIALPVTVKSAEAEAQFTNGIIKITLPKAEEVKPQKIAIRTY
jgi:HSP20 family protein